MKPSHFFTILFGVMLAGCAALPRSQPAGSSPSGAGSPSQVNTATPGLQMARLPDLGPAPELENKVWLNSDHPLRLQQLRGKVVLLEMWTFGCINCQHVIPSLRDWYQQYRDQGLVIIGNHFPEFSYEQDLGNLKDALQRLQITYPVAQDNDGRTWTAYQNRYWPALYLIDKRGHIRYTHIGEGAYDTTQSAIEALLKEPG